MGFDLSVIETRKYAEEGVFFPILHPATGEPLVDEGGQQIRIKLSGADASRIKSAVEEREVARKALAADKPSEAIPFNWETRERDVIEDLVLLTEGWTDNVMLDGAPLPFSKDNAKMLYQRFPEITEQMTRRAINRVNFMQTSASK